MHAGRQYPYHPTYHVTEGWFWPGFLPWKMHLEVFGSNGPPWNIFPAGHNENSVAGRIENGGQDVVYDFISLTPLAGLICRCSTTIYLGVKSCIWRVTLVQGAVTWGTAIAIQTIPQRRVLVNSYDWVISSIPYPAIPKPQYQFTPSRYNEVGSPWPLY